MPRRSLLVAAALLLPGTALAVARFHAALVKAVPAIDGAIMAAPAAVQLWFNEPVNARLTNATVLTTDSTAVATIQFIATPDSLNVVGPVGTLLPPGAYLVQWRTMSPDGHVVRGEYRFRYAP